MSERVRKSGRKGGVLEATRNTEATSSVSYNEPVGVDDGDDYVVVAVNNRVFEKGSPCHSVVICFYCTQYCTLFMLEGFYWYWTVFLNFAKSVWTRADMFSKSCFDPPD